MHRDRERLGRGQARPELPVDEQRPHVAERNVAHQIFDVDAPVAEGAALPVGLGNVGLERDNALKARFEVRHPSSLPVVNGGLCAPAWSNHLVGGRNNPDYLATRW